MRVGIVGGGIAGLTAAYELGQRGHTPVVFEKRPELGGQAATIEVGGECLEGFYHHIFTSDQEVRQLIDELGLGGDLRWLDSRVGFYHRGRVYPFVTPLDLLRFRPLRPVDRVRLGLASLYLRRYRDWQRLEGVTAREWVTRYAGRRSYEVVWGPMLRNKFGDSLDEVGMVWLWGKIHLRLTSRQGEHEQLGYIDGSYGRLIDALGEAVLGSGGEIYRGATATAVAVEGGKVVGLWVGGEVHPCDAVIATVSSPDFLQLAPPLPAEYGAILRMAHYQSAACLVLALNQPFMDYYWLNIGESTMPFVAVIEHTNFVEPSRYRGRRILYVSNYLSSESPLYGMGPQGLLDEYLPYLQRINPRFDLSWVEESHVFREEWAQPIVTTDYLRQIPDHRTPVPGLYLANTTQIYPEDRGMNYSVRLGRQIADIVTADGARHGEEG